jgi:hypothetical protein
VSAARLLLPTVLLAAGGQAAATAPAASLPAQWRSYDILLDLQGLPRTYSCDELWYRVRDVLLALGARAYMTLTPYDCGTTRSGEARSPRVHARFQLPYVLKGADTRYAEISVHEQPVQLAPGSPRSLQPQDCELVRQLQGTLLAGLPLQVGHAQFNCSGAQPAYSLTLDAPIAAGAPAGPPPLP